MIVLIGESASGKSTIEKELVNSFGRIKLVTYTTRSPRKGEVNGVDYWYVTDEDFDKLKSENFFCETAVYNGWQYGTATKDCTDEKVVVLTPHGFRQIRKNKELNLISFYIKIPRRDRLIRLINRGDDIEESYRRSLSDIGQFDGISDEVDFVINGVMDTELIASIILSYVRIKERKV